MTNVLILSSSEHCRAVVDTCDLSDKDKKKEKRKTQRQDKDKDKDMGILVTQLIMPEKLRN